MILKRVFVHGFTDEDSVWLQKAVVKNNFGWTAENVLDRIAVGDAIFWRVQGDASGCLITEEFLCPKGLCILITWMAGDGLLRNFNEIKQELILFAKGKGAFALMGEFSKKKFEKFYKSIGAGFNSTSYLHEIGD